MLAHSLQSVCHNNTKLLSYNYILRNSNRYLSSDANNKKNSCWNCDYPLHHPHDLQSKAQQQHMHNPLNHKTLFCPSPDCGAIQHYKFDRVNAFELFNIDKTFDIDLDKLDSEFKSLQKQLHPDRFATRNDKEQEISASSCSVINQAYQKLRMPVTRAEYLIKLEFNEKIFEESRMEDASQMMEIFELREEIDEADDTAALNAVHSTVQSKLSEVTAILSKAIKDHDRASAVDSAIRMKYYTKMNEEIEDKLHLLE